VNFLLLHRALSIAAPERLGAPMCRTADFFEEIGPEGSKTPVSPRPRVATQAWRILFLNHDIKEREYFLAIHDLLCRY
jgi:hypothetical protein